MSLAVSSFVVFGGPSSCWLELFPSYSYVLPFCLASSTSFIFSHSVFENFPSPEPSSSSSSSSSSGFGLGFGSGPSPPLCDLGLKFSDTNLMSYPNLLKNISTKHLKVVGSLQFIFTLTGSALSKLISSTSTGSPTREDISVTTSAFFAQPGSP
uniref:Uncharacterized protein n=1 Tax=Arundo donax TaxID=35708 RepID=A0A0A8XUA6_ARUDO